MADGGNSSNKSDVQGGVPRLLQCEHESKEISNVMNFLGYGPHIRQARRDAYKEYSRLMTALALGNSTYIITGSKAEGLTCYFENDLDSICVYKGVICLEEGVDSSSINVETIILRAFSHVSYPGHCILQLERYGSTMPINLNNALCDDGYGRELLSSSLYVNAWLNDEPTDGAIILERAGPSVHSVHHDGALHTDFVQALNLYCPSILTRWAARSRNWPTPNVVQEVVSLGAFVTPVGFKGSDNEHVEWRLCFNTGENVLVNNLNDAQVKLYVLLKMVKTDILKPRKKEITSFIVKNIVFWIAENNQQSLFHQKSLFHWLHEGLDALRVALSKREMPYYMLPERNLMAACALEHQQQRTWIAKIDQMMEEGPRIILRLPKIRQALIAHPEPLRWYSSRKIELEMLELINTNRIALVMGTHIDITMMAVMRRQLEINREVRLRMIMEGRRENDNLSFITDVFNKMLM